MMKSYTQFQTFSGWENGNYFIIYAPVESKPHFILFAPIFEKYAYDGNGYFWQNLITYILQELDKELLAHLEFDPELGSFFAYTKLHEMQLRFITLLNPIFSDLYLLEEYVKKVELKNN